MDIITIIFMILIKTGTKQPKGNVGTAAAKTPNTWHGRTVCCYSSSSHAGIYDDDDDDCDDFDDNDDDNDDNDVEKVSNLVQFIPRISKYFNFVEQ